MTDSDRHAGPSMEPELLRDHARFVEARCPDGETVAADMRQAADEIERLNNARMAAMHAIRQIPHDPEYWRPKALEILESAEKAGKDDA